MAPATRQTSASSASTREKDAAHDAPKSARSAKRLTVAFARLFAGAINEDSAVASRAVVSAVGLGLTKAKLSRNSNQLARGRIRRPNAARSMASRVEEVPPDFRTHRRFNNLRSYVARGG
jgi:hypothetical protein